MYYLDLCICTSAKCMSVELKVYLFIWSHNFQFSMSLSLSPNSLYRQTTDCTEGGGLTREHCMYIVVKYKINLHSLRNRLEKLAYGSLFYLFLKLVKIDFIFTNNIRILYIYMYLYYSNYQNDYLHNIKKKQLHTCVCACVCILCSILKLCVLLVLLLFLYLRIECIFL